MRKLGLVFLFVLAACKPSVVEEADFQPKVYPSKSNIKHLVVIVQENHSFDAYFGRWCKAAPGSNPTCTAGANCCEGAPVTDAAGTPPTELTDDMNGSFDPDHTHACMLSQMNGGKMDRYTEGVSCSDVRNFAIAGANVKPFHDMAEKYALGDRYFQSIAGGSSANNMYFAEARFRFFDNDVKPKAIGAKCDLASVTDQYTETMVGDLLTAKKINWRVYAEGFDAAVQADKEGLDCPRQPAPNCPLKLAVYPCIYTPSDFPYQYYKSAADKPEIFADIPRYLSDIKKGTLPAYSYVKGLGFHTEHAGGKTSISDGSRFVDDLVKAIDASPYYRENTLVLITWDESGGYYDHVPPPPTSTVDNKPYGARVPLIAVGRFAKKGYISHVEMEHSSIVKFIEWNWTGQTGQLKGRDATVNNIGSLLDPKETGATVPEK